ncbi:MAG: hypothetical protein QM811_02535 [Pirellulales bacterium]
MSRWIAGLATVLAFARVLAAAEPATGPDPSAYRARLIEVVAQARLTDDHKAVGVRFILPEDGLQLKFLVEGPHLAAFRDDGLKLNVLKTKQGEDLLTSEAGEYELEAMPRVADPKYGEFSFTLPHVDISELDGLRVQGTIAVMISAKKETLKSDAVDLFKKHEQPIALGPYQIHLGGVDHSKNAFPPGAEKRLGFSVNGDLQPLVDVYASVDGKRLNPLISTICGKSQWNDFEATGEGPGTIEIEVWKDLREVKIPFTNELPPRDPETPRRRPDDAFGGFRFGKNRLPDEPGRLPVPPSVDDR